MARKKRKRPSGQGSVFQRRGNWWIGWREGGRRRWAKFPDEETARRVLAKILSDAAAGRAGLPAEVGPVPTLAELAADWLKRRDATHRSADKDAGRWRLHLAPRLGTLRPDEVGPALLREIIEAKLAEGLSSSTCRLLMRLVSTFYSDLVERGLATQNPAKALPRATRRLIRPAHDPRTTPFVEKLEDVRRIYLALPEPLNLAYAIGSMGGLRTGEILALRWEHVDLATRRIHVRESIGGPLKDNDSRMVPIADSLLPLLRAWHLRSGGKGNVVPPMRGGTRKHLDPHTVGKEFKKALAKLASAGAALPALSWYQATRHTFASQWVLAGGAIEKLREVMGHCSVVVTERYAHLRTDLFTSADLGRVAVDFAAPTGKILPLPSTGADSGTVGCGMVAEAKETGKAGGT
jgi:integrase